MSPSNQRRRRSSFNPFLLVLLLLVAVVGTIGTLHAMGQVKIDAIDRLFGRKEVQAQETAHLVRVPVSARRIPPGKRVELADLIDPETRLPRTAPVHEDKVKEEWILDISAIEGRVMAREKAPTKAFSEKDFLPEGSRDGVVALIPKGRNLITLDARKVRGLELLSYEDRFDLVASTKVDEDYLDQLEKVLEDHPTNTPARRMRLEALKGAVDQQVLVSNGLVIEPADTKSRGASREQLVGVALRPDEIMPVLQAIDKGLSLYCVARTGLPGEEEASPLQARPSQVHDLDEVFDEAASVTIIEGGSSRTARVPKAVRD